MDRPGGGGIENKPSTDVVFRASDEPSPRVCTSTRSDPLYRKKLRGQIATLSINVDLTN
jgi:hypothetical protein